MFSLADAGRLRDSLPVMDFSGKATTSPLLEAYKSHYGLRREAGRPPVAHQVGTLDSGPFRLVCHYFTLPAGEGHGTVFVLHGYFDHTGLYGHLIDHCLRLGYSVVIFDLPGHGLSTGQPASIDSFHRYGMALLDCLRLAHEQGVAGPWRAVGQSTGAAVLMDSLLHHDLRAHHDIRSYLLLAPLLRPTRWALSMLIFAATRWLVEATSRRFTENSHDAEFVAFLRDGDPLQSEVLPRDWVLALMDYLRRFKQAAVNDTPLHIIQGTGDRTVDWSYNLTRITRKFPESTTYMITGARHHLVNESPEYRDRVFQLIADIFTG